jgi:flagellar biosynthesis protein FliR
MGLISRAVPTVNIFIVSFPLTIGIGLILSLIALPEMIVLVTQHFDAVELSIERVLADALMLNPQN